MNTIIVKSRSNDDVYEVTFHQNGDDVKVVCSCPAGKKLTLCWHRLALIDGDVAAVVSGHEYVASLRQGIAGSTIASALAELQRLETQAETIKRQIGAVKKTLGISLG
ncbi:hypothetical protein FNL56_13270 [Tardiphaga sp. vice304]|uniref:hypothetical protein n=1 Tax=Tardiphaga sp. vice304 TaxID=2592817 RepID=UPI0011654463|nr:hypothetical protein [Tardiphaga sp. vice304]QDM26971.1 hypothetical protein FNL56_13270 [Tardiphaga sp. vice304]